MESNYNFKLAEFVRKGEDASSLQYGALSHASLFVSHFKVHRQHRGNKPEVARMGLGEGGEGMVVGREGWGLGDAGGLEGGVGAAGGELKGRRTC